MNYFIQFTLVMLMLLAGPMRADAQQMLKLKPKAQTDLNEIRRDRDLGAAKVVDGLLTPNQNKLLSFQQMMDKTETSKINKVAPRSGAAAVGNSDSGEYQFAGFNITLPGVIQFNVSPYEQDTLAVDSSLTEYAFCHEGKYYAFKPIWNSATMNYDQMDCVVFNTADWEKDDSVRLNIANQGEVPYITLYDNTTGQFYCISMMSTYKTHTDSYELNILDPTTFKMTKVGHICSWTWMDDEHQQSINGAVMINGEIIAIDNYNRLVKIDKNAGALSIIGKMKIGYSSPQHPDYDQITGLQGMVYEESTGDIIISHLDYLEGAYLYRVHPNDITDGVISTEKMDELYSTYYYIYAQNSGMSAARLTSPSDFKIEMNDMKANISFTVPSKMVNGTQLSGDGLIKAEFMVDGIAVSLGEVTDAGVAPGTVVNKQIDLAKGLHTISLTLSATGFDASLGEIASSQTISKMIYAGYDVPTVPTDAKLTIADNTATITWTAPATGENAQWGAVFDPSDLTYTVTRTYDNKVVAKDITATQCVDTELGDVMHTYTYLITAKSHDAVSETAKTNSVVNGKYVELPYINDFSSSESLDFFTNHSLNQDGEGRQWSWNYIQRHITTMPSATYYNNNYWLYSPSFAMDTEHVYRARFDFTPNGRAASTGVRMAVTLGQTTNENERIDTLMNYDGKKGDVSTETVYFRAPQSGYYNIAFWDYSPLDNNDDGGSVIIDNLEISEALSVAAPDKVSGLNLAKGENGALKAILTFTLPTKTISGEAISSLSAVKVLVGDEVVGTIDNPAPGSTQTIEVDAINGVNTYAVAAYNNAGQGWPVEVRDFVGPDVPDEVQNFRVNWGENENQVEMTWDAPEIGANGGYVDSENLTYNVYGYDGNTATLTLLQSGVETTNFTYTENTGNTQAYFAYQITANNEVGESEAATRTIFLGKAYELPFAEPFAGTSLETAPWMTDTDKNGLFWDVDAGDYDLTVIPVNNDDLKLMFRSDSNLGGAGRINTPIIDLTGHDNASFNIYLYHDINAGENGFCRIDATTNGMDFEPVSDTIYVGDNAGWVKHVIPLKKYAGKRISLGLYGSIDDPAYRLFADSVSVVDMPQNDLAVSAVSYDAGKIVKGSSPTVTVTVANQGVNAMSDYAVEFFVNDVNVGEVMPDEALAMGEMRQFSFTVPVTAGTDTVKCYAQVVADEDERPYNDISQTVSIVPQISTLPAPVNLRGELKDGKVELAWEAPEVADGLKIVDDFENNEAFTLDNINGWNTYDADKQRTISMIRLTDNYWPNCHLAQAWMVWNPLKALCEDSYWQAKDGSQCIISWGSSGVGSDGYLNLEGYINDDWFISPEIKGGTELEFDAYATTSSVYGDSYMEVLTSSTDRNAESFTTLKSFAVGGDIEAWQHFSFTLPEDAKYVAIRNRYTEFAILLDNLTYTLDKTPVLKGYNVYQNGSLQNDTPLSATAFTGLNEGEYRVSAVYDLGESEPQSTVVSTGIKDVTYGVTVKVEYGDIVVSGARNVKVYNTAGMQIASVDNDNNVKRISVSEGVYLVKADKATYKIMVNER